jgi:hypothetical protein
MDGIQNGRRTAVRIGAYRLLLAAAVFVAGASAARAQFLCPPLEGIAAGDIPASTVTIQVFGETAVLGGVAPIRTSMAGSEGNVASVFFDICFDATKLDIAEELQSTGAPCDVKEDCPGAQPCGDDGTCQALVVTACTLAGTLGQDHVLRASSPEIPENPDNPRRLRLLIADANRNATACTTPAECAENEICPFGRCVRTCANNDDCPPGNRCKAFNDGAGQGNGVNVCSPLNIVPNGDLVNCTFDVAEDPTIAGMTPLTEGLLQVADDSIPVAMAIPAVFVPGSINLVPCTNTNQCPEGKVCDPDGVCRVPTPTPTPTVTNTGPTATPTDTPITVPPTTPPTVPPTTPPTVPPTTPPTIAPTTPPTSGPSATPTITRTRTASPTSTGDGQGGGGGGCNCAIQPAQEAGWMRTLVPLLIPAAMLWGRRRRY